MRTSTNDEALKKGTPAERPRLRRPAITATAAELAGNLALLVAGRAAGASFAVPDRGEPGALMQIGPGAVALSTLLPLVVGLGVAALVTRRWPRTAVALKALAVFITLASIGMPLGADTDTGTRILLAVMHLVVGGAYLATVRGTRSASAVTVEAATAVPATSPSRR